MSHTEQSADRSASPASDVLSRGVERRTSARIPIFGPVRMGPPSGEPYAPVSAANLSRSGLFIDADRPVRIGARFSAEIPLRSGGAVYVPEAEVAYFREHMTGSGFGVRFIDPPAEVVAALEREIALVTGSFRPFLTPEPDVLASSPPAREHAPGHAAGLADDAYQTLTDLPGPTVPGPTVPGRTAVARGASARSKAVTLRPGEPPVASGDDALELPEPLPHEDTAFAEPGAGHSGGDGLSEPVTPQRARLAEDVSLPPEPGFEPSGPYEPVTEPRFRRTLEDLMHRAHDARHALVERGRRFPLAWTAVALAGALTVAGAAVLAVSQGPSPESADRGPEPADRGFSATTQQVLMGERQAPALVPPAELAPPEAEPKSPLPPLVVLDEAGKPAESSARKAEPGRTDPGPAERAGAASEHAARASRGSGERSAAAVAHPSTPRAPAARGARPAQERKAPEERAVQLASTVAPKPFPAKAVAHPPRSTHLHFRLSAHASVLKTHVLKSPNRFVVDLVGMDGPVAPPPLTAHVKRVRFGRHPEFLRVVIETDAPIEQGRVSRSGHDLSVTLDYQ